MSKILKILTMLTMSAFLVFFVAGCTFGDSDDGNGGGGDIAGVLPDGIDTTKVPTVNVAGELTMGLLITPTPIPQGATINTLVVQDFIDLYMQAITSGAVMPTRARSANSNAYIIEGEENGAVRVVEESDGDIEKQRYEFESLTNEFFDFSNVKGLFLGGGVGYFNTQVINQSGGTNIVEQSDGTIHFAGTFRGKIVFDNVIRSTTRAPNGTVDSSRVAVGDFYLETHDGVRIDIPKSMLSSFVYRKSENSEVIATPDFVAVDSIRLADVETSVKQGDTLRILTSVFPITATNRTIAWTVQNATLSADNRTIIFDKVGTATITATIANGAAVGTAYTRTWTVTVSKDQNGDGGITIPNNPPAVSAADRDRQPTSGADMANAAVTQANLDEFVQEFLAALNMNNSFPASVRSLPQEGSVGTESGRETWTLNGLFGSMEVTQEWQYEAKWTAIPNVETETDVLSGTVKFFDFSASGNLFLAGAFGYLNMNKGRWSDTENANDFEDFSFKIDGRVNFAGAFVGSIVFNNVIALVEDSNDDWGTIISKITGGEFFVESKGAKTTLPLNLLEVFRRVNDDKNADFGDTPVINRQMPNVPTAPSGSLTNRAGGQEVTAANLDGFLDAFYSEIYNYDTYSAKSRGIEASFSRERIEHGQANGHLIDKGSGTHKTNNNARVNLLIWQTEYFDYSNLGALFFGGGVGGASIEESGENSNGFWDKYESVLNGQVRFNGDFRGTLEFRNFRYKYEYSEQTMSSTYTHVSGSVFIGSLDVTQEYFEAVIKRW